MKDWRIGNHIFFSSEQARFRFIKFIKEALKQVPKGFDKDETNDILVYHLTQEYDRSNIECVVAIELYNERLKDMKIGNMDKLPSNFNKRGDWRIGQKLFFKPDLKGGKETGKYRKEFMKFMNEHDNKKIKGESPDDMKRRMIFAIYHKYEVDVLEAEAAYDVYLTYMKPENRIKYKITELKKDYQNEYTKQFEEAGQADQSESEFPFN